MCALTHHPTVERLADLLERHYGLSGRIEALGGENPNYLVVTGDDRRFVLKLLAHDLPADRLEFERRVIDAAAHAGLGIQVPRAVAGRDDAVVLRDALGDGSGVLAVLSDFVPGTEWRLSGPPTRARLQALGAMLGALDRALESVPGPATPMTHPWDLETASRHRAKVELVSDSARRRLVDDAFQLYAASAVPRLSELPRSVIHGDANDENVLVQDGRIVGLLDFGDCLESPTVCELAIVLAYAMLDHDDPLTAGAQVVAGYCGQRALSEQERAVLFPLVCGRLAVTVAMAAEREDIDPRHASWFVTRDRAWHLLETLAAIDPASAAWRLAAETGSDRPAVVTGSPELVRQRAAHVAPSLSLHYREPLQIVDGRGPYLIDERGRPFLDLVNNVCHVGHCHPRVVAAGQRQMARLNTNTRYLHQGLTDYARRLCDTLPEPLDTCLFVNSGSEANELALRLARAHTQRHDVMVVEGAYHGHTSSLIDMSPFKFMGAGGTRRAAPWVHVAPIPDGYRGKHRGADRATGEAYGDEVRRVIERAPAPIAAFFTESLWSCAGQIVPPPGYLETAFRHAREHGALCVIDEVQVGFARTGHHFWAFEAQHVVPDIVVMGKPIGNGHPMAAVVTTRAIAESFANGMEFFSTFGGNPVSCAIGLAVLDVIRDERLQEHARVTGARLRAGLVSLTERYPLIGDVRGMGLFLGVELVSDPDTRAPASDEANEVVNRIKDRGVLLSTDGPDANVLKIKPPLVLSADDADHAVRALDAVLSEVS